MLREPLAGKPLKEIAQAVQYSPIRLSKVKDELEAAGICKIVRDEELNLDFIAAMRAFVAEGQYEISERSPGVPILYRFAKPGRREFPIKLELSTRNHEHFDLGG